MMNKSLQARVSVRTKRKLSRTDISLHASEIKNRWKEQGD